MYGQPPNILKMQALPLHTTYETAKNAAIFLTHYNVSQNSPGVEVRGGLIRCHGITPDSYICASYRIVTEDRTAVLTSEKGGQLHILDKIAQLGRLK